MQWLWLATVPVLLLTWLLYRAFRSEIGWRAELLYLINVSYCRLMFGWKALNECTIPEEGAAIIVANHTSPVDPMLLWNRHHVRFRSRKIRVPGFLMAREYYEQPGLVGWISRVMESIPVTRGERDTTAIRAALKRLQDGELLGIFPEGRINQEAPDRTTLPAETGVAWLAVKARVPVIPVCISGAPRASSMVRCFLTRARVRITYGQPLFPSEWIDGRPKTEDLESATERIMQSLAELGNMRSGGVQSAQSEGVGTATS